MWNWNSKLLKRDFPGSLVIWTSTCTSSAGDTGLIPGWGTRISHAGWPKQTNKQNPNHLSCTVYWAQRSAVPLGGSPKAPMPFTTPRMLWLGFWVTFSGQCSPSCPPHSSDARAFCGPSLLPCEDGSDVPCMLTISWEWEGGARWRRGIHPLWHSHHPSQVPPFGFVKIKHKWGPDLKIPWAKSV